MGSSIRWLRVLVAVQWLAAAAGMVVEHWLADSLPEPLRSYVPPEVATEVVVAAGLALLVAVALGVVGSVGILLRWPPARMLYVLGVAVWIAATPWVGAAVVHAWAAPLYGVSTLASGATVALLYFSPAARDFGPMPAAPPAAPRSRLGVGIRLSFALLVALLAATGAVVLAGAGVGFAAYVFVDRVEAEGRLFGASVDDAACLAEARGRNLGTQWFANGSFLEACLETARPNEAFCRDVPAPSDSFEPSPWSEERCAKEADDGSCTGLLDTIQVHCAERRSRAVTEASPPE